MPGVSLCYFPFNLPRLLSLCLSFSLWALEATLVLQVQTTNVVCAPRRVAHTTSREASRRIGTSDFRGFPVFLSSHSESLRRIYSYQWSFRQLRVNLSFLITVSTKSVVDVYGLTSWYEDDDSEQVEQSAFVILHTFRKRRQSSRSWVQKTLTYDCFNYTRPRNSKHKFNVKPRDRNILTNDFSPIHVAMLMILWKA